MGLSGEPLTLKPLGKGQPLSAVSGGLKQATRAVLRLAPAVLLGPVGQ
jgi:hypothetical protein